MNHANPDVAPHFSSLALQPLPPHSLFSAQPRINDLLRGRISRFSLDALVNISLQ